MVTFRCKVCGKEDPEHIWRCEEHYRCDDCGTRERLCQHVEGLLCDSCKSKRVDKRIAAFKGNTDFTDAITCPHCGYVYSDSFDYSEGEQECSDCGRSFDLTRHVEVTYCTEKLSPGK